MESRHEQWQRESEEATITVNRNKYLKMVEDLSKAQARISKLERLLQENQTNGNISEAHWEER